MTTRESRSLGKLVEDVDVLVHEVNGYGNHAGFSDSSRWGNCDPWTIVAQHCYGFAGAVDLGCYATAVSTIGARRHGGGMIPNKPRFMPRRPLHTREAAK